MKIGYPCIHDAFDCRPSRTFRLANYSQEYLIEKISGNLDCLEKILLWNVEHDLLFFRITSDLIPFGSHPVHDFDFATYFRDKFTTLREIISASDMRISMHPGQYTLLNAKDEEVVGRAVADLEYHADVLDALGLDGRHKIQIHVGGVYGDKPAAMERFISQYQKLPERIQDRLVIENDDVSYSVADCLEIHKEIGIPIIFDNLHHACLHEGEDEKAALQEVAETWKKEDGIPMIDYSDQEPEERKGKHRTHIDVNHFREFLRTIRETRLDVDIMLEIKDKEKSALLARKALDE
ncbi:MAG: UV DNA damage repair endonuclease UvsE [Candidatus Paceibacterota bacterium]